MMEFSWWAKNNPADHADSAACVRNSTQNGVAGQQTADHDRNDHPLEDVAMRKLLLAVAMLTLACGGDSTTEPTNASVAGTWSLSTVNGTALPYILAQSGADKI